MIRALLLITILILGGFLIWQLTTTKKQPHPAQTQTTEWFGEHVVLTEMTPQGQIKHQISADTLTHYGPQNITDLFNVKLIVFPENRKEEWHLSSDKGRLFHDTSLKNITRIDLWHNVLLLRPKTATQAQVSLETSTLAIFPEKEYAHTDQTTIIKQVGQQISGQGMEIFFDRQQFHLINNVNSTHEQNS